MRSLNILLGFFICTGISYAELIQKPYCVKRKINSRDGVECKGNFSDPESLREEMKKFENIFSLWMEDVLLDALPSDTFNVTEGRILLVDTVVFQNVTLHLLHVPELGAQPFESVRGNLERFEIYDSKGVFAWDWEILAEMKKLNTLIVENSLIIAVPPSIGSAPDLRFIELRKAEIKWLHPTVFSGSSNLTFCSLAYNKIEIVQRRMFPSPANKLWSLDFSNNKLQMLPDDIFESMPALQELKLDNNQLINIGEALKRVWKDLTQLWLQKNTLTCSLLCWTKNYTNQPLFFGATMCSSEEIDQAFSKYECPKVTNAPSKRKYLEVSKRKGLLQF